MRQISDIFAYWWGRERAYWVKYPTTDNVQRGPVLMQSVYIFYFQELVYLQQSILLVLSVCRGKQKSRRKMPQKRCSSNTGDESSEPSPKSKKRGRKEPVVDEEPLTRQNRRRSRPLSENDEEDDADEPVSKRPTRRRKLRESEENSGETQREDRGNSSSKRRNSEELSFGRRSRNRNRGQNSEVFIEFMTFPFAVNLSYILLFLFYEILVA